MRIEARGCRYEGYDCGAEYCDRFYCATKTHRLIYTSCATELIKDCEGDRDVVNGVHYVEYYSEECPECHREWERRKYAHAAKV